MFEHDVDEVIHRPTIKNRCCFKSPGGFFYLRWIGRDDLHGIGSVHVLQILQQEASSKPGRLDPRLKSQVCADISINKARCFSFQQDIRQDSCQFLIHLPILRRRHINHTFGGLLSRRRFAAKFRAFDQYRADPLQFAFQKVVNNPVLVSCRHLFLFLQLILKYISFSFLSRTRFAS